MTNFLCIGIPARNEEKSIERTIQSIVESKIWQQTSSRDKELIVCVNDSNDRTLQKIHFPNIP